jgi:hypothetical protein
MPFADSSPFPDPLPGVVDRIIEFRSFLSTINRNRFPVGTGPRECFIAAIFTNNRAFSADFRSAIRVLISRKFLVPFTFTAAARR